MAEIKRLRYLLLLPVAVIIIGTFGFMWLEKLSFLDAFYFTVTTITTVGYGDITPHTVGGKILAIIVIVFGVSTVLAILSNVLQWYVRRQQRIMHGHRLNMLIGVFFTEAGNQLLRILTSYDPNLNTICQECQVNTNWTAEEFQHLKKQLTSHHHNIDEAKLDLQAIHEFLTSKGDLFVRQLENPDIVDNEGYAELLWAAVHLRDELTARSFLKDLPKTDLVHLVNDVKRVYTLITPVWTNYMQYLKGRYPFLFSLALRTNPFAENPDAVIKEG